MENEAAYILLNKTKRPKDIKVHLENLTGILRGSDVSNKIFANYDKSLAELEVQITNKHATLDRYNKLTNGLKELV